ncbi:hypothetical protein PsW64_02435 [Pseudovibrio sp. W64]|nr:hypothetical protein PsW64_02435 [Pseudovibrio sp. W64]
MRVIVRSGLALKVDALAVQLVRFDLGRFLSPDSSLPYAPYRISLNNSLVSKMLTNE